MTMYLYSGTPGSGKSMHVAEKIYYRLITNRPVIANFDIDTAKIKKKHIGDFTFRYNWDITPKFLIEYSMNYFKDKNLKEDTILLCLDECQMLFNAREWNKQGRDEWLSFFTQHRKYGFMIILIAQFDRMIDRQIRSLIEYEYVHRKVKNFGWRGWLLSFWCAGNLFMCKQVWYPMKEKIGAEFFLLKMKFVNLYDTHNTFAVEEREGEGVLRDSGADTLEDS